MRHLISTILFSYISLIFALPAAALSNKLSTTFEAGVRSATDTIEDRDLSGNLDFYRYRLRFDQEISKSTKYSFSYEHYRKDYETSDNLDASSNEWRFGLDQAFLDAFKLYLDAGFRQKDYKNSSSLEYDRSNMAIGLGYKSGDLWALRWDNGFTNYDYTKSGNDQFKVFTKLSGWAKFFDERLKINPSYKFQNIDEDSSKDRTENTASVNSYYKLKLPHFDKISGFYSVGRNDTKDSEDEDRDDDVHFKYTKWHAGTEHPLSESIGTFFKYGQIRRDYQDSDSDYRTWYVENKTDFELYDDKSRQIKFSITGEHKEGDFHLVDSLNYIKNTLTNKFSYKIKNNWELTPSFTFKTYNYTASPTKNEKQYVTNIEFTKELLNENLELNLAYKYVWKEYKYKSDIEQWSIKAGIEYKF